MSNLDGVTGDARKRLEALEVTRSLSRAELEQLRAQWARLWRGPAEAAQAVGLD